MFYIIEWKLFFVISDSIIEKPIENNIYDLQYSITVWEYTKTSHRIDFLDLKELFDQSFRLIWEKASWIGYFRLGCIWSTVWRCRFSYSCTSADESGNICRKSPTNKMGFPSNGNSDCMKSSSNRSTTESCIPGDMGASSETMNTESRILCARI